jgi:hypothetical protein
LKEGADIFVGIPCYVFHETYEFMKFVRLSYLVKPNTPMAFLITYYERQDKGKTEKISIPKGVEFEGKAQKQIQYLRKKGIVK